MSYSEGTVTANRGLGQCSSLSFRPDYLELTIWVSDWFGLGGLWDQETIPRSKDPYYGKLIRGLMGFSKPHKVGNPTKAKLCWVLVLSLHNKEPYYLLQIPITAT